MAKKAKTVDEKLDDGEVSTSEMAPAEEEGLSNGLGLERFIPPPTPGEKKPAKVTSKAKVEEQEPPAEKDVTEPAEEPEEETVETLSKRLKDTRDWATKLNKQNKQLDALTKQLQQEVQVLKQTLDGTYVPPSPEEQERIAKEKQQLAEKIKVSRAVAEAKYGKDVVEQMIFAEGAPYRELEEMDPLIKARVFSHEQPVMAAMQELQWWQFRQKYGDTPDEIETKLRDKVKWEIVESMKKDKKATGSSVAGLGNVGGVPREEAPKGGQPSTIELSNIFTGFPTGSF